MYYDLLARIKNAALAGRESVQAPFSQLGFDVARVLQENGYLAGVEKRNVGKKSVLEVRLKYQGKKPAITDFKIVSRPSRRFYLGYREMRPVKRGYGLAVFSTPAGVMSAKSARKNKVGGECLFEIW